jgi:hypothetical protein
MAVTEHNAQRLCRNIILFQYTLLAVSNSGCENHGKCQSKWSGSVTHLGPEPQGYKTGIPTAEP